MLRVIEQPLLERGPGSGSEAKGATQIGAVAFIHHFGASINEHTHFHASASSTICRILDPIGAPSTPPPLATARGSPGWDSEETTQEDPTWGLPPVDPQPDDDLDRTVSW